MPSSSTLATVANTGNYTDLIGKLTLFSGAYTDLTGKPTLFSGAYSALTGTPTIPAASPWTTNGTKIYYNYGNVGIGITNPTHTLQVNGSIQASTISVGGINVSGTINLSGVVNVGGYDNAGGNSWVGYFSNSDYSFVYKPWAATYSIATVKDVWSSTGFLVASDTRIKNVIEGAWDDLSLLNALRPIRFRHKDKIKFPGEDGEGKERIGFLAQEVQQDFYPL